MDTKTCAGLTTRRGLLAAGLGWGLSACGGGDSGPAEAPAIQRLDAGAARIGEPTTLTPVFSGGNGRIEPGLGPVHSGVAVTTPVLAGPRRFTLVVEAPGRPAARRDIDLAPAYRDRYTAFAAPWLQYHAASVAADGTVLVIGGSRGLAAPSEAVDRFDPATRRFTRIGSLYTGRAMHTATRLANGQVLVLGGLVGLSSGGFAELIDEATGTVTAAGWPVRPRARHAAVALADGRVLVVGGLNSDSVELWDPATRRFRLVAARMAHAREFPTATLLADGRVLIVGGDPLGATQQLAEVFDPAQERFAPVVSPPDALPRALHAAHALPDGRVLVLGGEVREGDALRPLDSVAVFDPAAQTLAPLGRLDAPRSGVRSVLGLDGQVRLFGGFTPGEAVARSASAFAPGGGRALAEMPAGRAWHTVSALPDGRLLVLGGDDADGGPVLSGLLYD